MIPKRPKVMHDSVVNAVTPDNIIFDKAERAELHNDFCKRLTDAREELKFTEQEINLLDSTIDASALSLKKTYLEARIEQLLKYISKLEDRMSE